MKFFHVPIVKHFFLAFFPPPSEQVIALVDALLMHPDSGVHRVLVLSPVNTIYNWRNEYNRWIESWDCDYNVSRAPFYYKRDCSGRGKYFACCAKFLKRY